MGCRGSVVITAAKASATSSARRPSGRPTNIRHRVERSTNVATGPERAVQAVQQVKGLGPFAAELVVLRGANAPDALPRHERRLEAEITERYGTDRSLAEVSAAWRPYRTGAAVHLRALREPRTRDIGGGTAAKGARSV